MRDSSANQPPVGRLLDDPEFGFPLCPAPFAELAERFGLAERTLLGLLEQWRREGKISRIGAVFAPKRIGASTLAAVAVTGDRLDAVARAINRFPEVTHNYERDHRYNLWFVVTAGSEGRLQAVLGAIEQAVGYPLLTLPMRRQFYAEPGGSGDARSLTLAQPTALDESERRLLVALQEGLPLFMRPFSILASRVGCDENQVIERIRRWIADGVIKHFGVVVRRREPDDGVSAMLVLDVADGEAERVGEALARERGVVFCYERQRARPGWPYNLFAIIRGPTREAVQALIDNMRQRLGLAAYAGEVLYSLTRFKRDGVPYA